MSTVVRYYSSLYGVAEAPARFSYVYSASRPQLFMDIDLDSDIDDVVDVLLAMKLALGGYIDLAGFVTTSQRNPTPGALLALLNHYGFTDRNIGHNSYSVGFPGVGGTSIYGQTLATTYGVVGRKDPYNFYEARGVQRYTLAQSAANGIDYITTGDLLSVKRLLESQADSAGPSGPQLVANKVKALWIVGGYWPSGTAVSDFGGSAARAAVSDYVLQNWPSSVPIYLVNILDGDTVTTGGSVMVALNSANPARVAWELYFARSNPADTRPGWSQIALLAIAFGLGAGYLQIADSGVASVNPTTGNTSFNPGVGNHHYLSKVMSDANFISTINSYLTDP